LDRVGRCLGQAAFPATAAGYRQLTGWLRGFGPVDRVGVESTGAYGAGLARHLDAEGIQVRKVNQPHPHTRRRRDKADAIDVEAPARKALSGHTTIIPKDPTGIVEVIRLLRVAHGGAVKASAAALHQLGELLVTAPKPLRQQVCSQRKTLKGRIAVCARLRPDPARLDDPMRVAKLILRATAERAQLLNQQARALQEQLDRLVCRAAPQTTALLGVGVGHAGQLLVTAGRTWIGCAVRRRSPTCAAWHRCR
jgi:transposase